jgi:hypothetical protein
MTLYRCISGVSEIVCAFGWSEAAEKLSDCGSDHAHVEEGHEPGDEADRQRLPTRELGVFGRVLHGIHIYHLECGIELR